MPLHIAATRRPWSELSTDCLALLCNEADFAGPLADAARGTPLADLDRALGGQLSTLAAAEKFRGKKGQSLTFTTLEKISPSRVVLLGLGADPTVADLRLAGGRATKLATGFGSASLGLVVPASVAPESRREIFVQALAEGVWLGQYRFDKYLSEDRRNPSVLAQAELALSGADTMPDLARIEAAIERARTTAAAVARARDLVNEPPVAMTPSLLARAAEDIAKQHGLHITVLGPDECRSQGMGLFLAVAQGSDEPARFIHMVHKPANARKRVVLIGKGVTFDSGGLSLKPTDGMLDMKTDMAGAAAVITAMGAIAAEKLPIEVHGIAACAENMLSGKAYRLGDVLRSKAGKTVEINNTDAEGRLTLADAITYALALSPDQILDFATLTGACIVALGPHIAGVMSNDKVLADAWLEAAQQAGEDMWPLPLPEKLNDMLRSEIADMKNTGERWGGALTAGLFLKSFVGDVPWVHVDLAGPSTSDKDVGHASKGGSGFAVSTILCHLRNLSAS